MMESYFLFKPFQPSVAFHIETRHLICTANQMTGFYMKCNTGLEWNNLININPINWSDTLKQFVSKLLTNCLSVFDHFVGLVLKGLTTTKKLMERYGTSTYLRESYTINL